MWNGKEPYNYVKNIYLPSLGKYNEETGFQFLAISNPNEWSSIRRSLRSTAAIG